MKNHNLPEKLVKPRLCIAIVDPYSSGSILLEELLSVGVAVVIIYSGGVARSTPRSEESLKKAIFAVNYDGSFGNLCKSLKKFNIDWVVPGTESGVELADKLSVALDCPHNDFQYSAARRNKYDMHNRLRECGLRYIDQRIVFSVDEAGRQFDKLSSGTVVVKPMSSAGSDNVWICYSRDEAIEAVTRILGTVNRLGSKNFSAIICEYIHGREYVVDTVSQYGHRFTTNLCTYTKDIVGKSFIYRETNYLEPHGLIADQLIKYNDLVLDALGVRTGASHSEIILDDHGPVLVEVNCRLHGGITGPQVINSCSGIGPVQVLVQSFIDKEKFISLRRREIKFNAQAVAFTFSVKQAGILDAFVGEAEIRSLPSFYTLAVHVKTGLYVEQTRDVYSSPGWVVLKNVDALQLKVDLEVVRRLDAEEKLFEIRT